MARQFIYGQDYVGSEGLRKTNENFEEIYRDFLAHQANKSNPHGLTRFDLSLDSFYVGLSRLGAANGVPTLDANGKIPAQFYSALALVTPYVVTSQAQQLSLSSDPGVQQGDMAIRTDVARTYVHNGGTTGTMSDWTLMQTPTAPVQTVNGQAGNVSLDARDVGAVPAGEVFVGEMKQYAGATSPSPKWAICNGAARPRTDDLFAVIGTTYGTGDGSTTYNLPDMRGRTMIGAGQGPSLTNRILGAKVGGETVTLTVSEMPTHGHSNGSTGSANPDLTHNHEYSFDAGSRASGNLSTVNQMYNGVSGSSLRNTSSVKPNAAHDHNIPPTNDAGGGNAHGNMQPSVVTNFLIKVNA